MLGTFPRRKQSSSKRRISVDLRKKCLMSVTKQRMDNHITKENHVQQVEPPRQLSDIERQESSISLISNQSAISDLERQQDEIEKQQDEMELKQKEMEEQQKEIKRQQEEMEREKEKMEQEHREAMEKLNREMEQMKSQLSALTTQTQEVKKVEVELKQELEKTKSMKVEKVEKKKRGPEGHITLKRISTFDPRLHMAANLVVVPSTGDVVIYARTKEADPLAFHIYNYDADSERLTHRILKDICECDYYVRMLPVRVNDEDLMCVSCPGCKHIKLLNIKTGTFDVAFEDDRFLPYRMCSGRDNTMFAHSYQADYPIIELNTHDEDFTIAQTLEHSGMWDCWGMCYAPDPADAVILSNQHDDSIHAISYTRDQQMWTKKGEVDGEKMDPRGLLFYPEHQVVLVSDGVNERILVLNPADGSHMATLNPGKNTGTVVNMGLYGETLVMMHYAHKKFKLSFFNIE